MNRDNLNIMIDTFKRPYKAPLPEHPDKGFNMMWGNFRCIESQHDCGTASCIMGWITLLGSYTNASDLWENNVIYYLGSVSYTHLTLPTIYSV